MYRQDVLIWINIKSATEPVHTGNYVYTPKNSHIDAHAPAGDCGGVSWEAGAAVLSKVSPRQAMTSSA